MSDQGFSEAFCCIVELAEALGVERVNEMPGCWRVVVGPWSIAVNAHREPIDSVPPFSAAVLHRDWPAGIIHPRGGTMLAGAEDAFIAAMRAEIARARESAERRGGT